MTLLEELIEFLIIDEMGDEDEEEQFNNIYLWRFVL